MERNDEFSYFFLFLQYICISNLTNDSYLMTELDSKTIKALRFPLTFLVVLLHCMGRDQGMIHWDELTVNDFPLIVKCCLALYASWPCPPSSLSQAISFFRNYRIGISLSIAAS